MQGPSFTAATILALLAFFSAGCESDHARSYSTQAYYDHDYPQARDSIRAAAEDRKSPDVVLTNMRLGLASLADGDLDEAEHALLRAYEYLTSGGVNESDRTIGSEVVYEGVRVWKGEPYEQAMSFAYVSVLYMMRADWENGRAAAANSLFALRDFGDDDSMRDLAETATAHERASAAARKGGDYFDTGYKPVESEFALGYLLAATNYVLMGLPEESDRLFDHVRKMRPDLAPLADTLRSARYDTLLIVDGGKGPTKKATGGDDAEIRFVPDGRVEPVSKLTLAIDGRAEPTVGGEPVVDLWRLSQFPRWWSLESMRQSKRLLGNALLIGGLGAAAIGSAADSDEAVYAGLGAMAAGLLLKASSKADTRHLEVLPRTVNLVPLNLGEGRHDVTVTLAGGVGGSSATWHDLSAGLPGKPRVYYLRMHDAAGRGMPQWSSEPLYSVDAARMKPGDRPWIMGGADLSVPTADTVAEYHSRGLLNRLTLEQLLGVHRAEGIVFRTGRQGLDGDKAVDRDWYRHLTNYGRVLFTPTPGTHAYERITRTHHGTYRPRSQLLRDIIQQHNFGPQYAEPAGESPPRTGNATPAYDPAGSNPPTVPRIPMARSQP